MQCVCVCVCGGGGGVNDLKDYKERAHVTVLLWWILINVLY